MARKLGLSVLVVGLVAGLIGFATFAAFSDTTTNEDNFITTGTVSLTDNDANGPMYELPNATPGVPHSSCIEVTYTGDMNAEVELYSTTGVSLGSLGEYVNLTVEVGTQASVSFPDCTDFVPVGSALFNGTLSQFVDENTAALGGLTAAPDGQTEWSSSDGLVYRFTVEVQNDPGANGLGTGPHQFTWRANSV